MFLCVDAYYTGCNAWAAGIIFPVINSATATREYVARIKQVEVYIPGQFYKKELPVILELLEQVEEKIQTIIIDGHAWLSTEKDPGLGAKLYIALKEEIPVIGVAKSPYRDTPAAVKVFRGASSRPLYVTAAGMDDKEAARLIRMMHGSYRIPTMLRYADRLSRLPAV